VYSFLLSVFSIETRIFHKNNSRNPKEKSSDPAGTGLDLGRGSLLVGHAHRLSSQCHWSSKDPSCLASLIAHLRAAEESYSRTE
jgi:hypothetical protein